MSYRGIVDPKGEQFAYLEGDVLFTIDGEATGRLEGEFIMDLAGNPMWRVMGDGVYTLQGMEPVGYIGSPRQPDL
jgi:hypothetical protein